MPTEVSTIKTEDKSQRKTVVKEYFFSFLSIRTNVFGLISIESDIAEARLLRAVHVTPANWTFNI